MKSLFTLRLICIFSLCLLFAVNPIRLFAESGHDEHEEAAEHEGEEHGDEHEGDEHEEHKEEPKKGAHNGRLLQQDNFTVELAIFERGIPPEYRAWASIDGKPLPPDQWQLTVELKRLEGNGDTFTFKTEQDFLRGQGIVEEPHSFDVIVTASHKEKQYQWKFESYEGRIALAAELAQQSGLTTAIAEPGNITQMIKLYGQVMIDPARVRQLQARYPGVIQTVNVVIGQKVKAGEVLATIEANDSLRTYSLLSPINGSVVARNANTGEMADDKDLFTIVDDSHLLVSFPVYSRDASFIRSGQTLEINAETLKTNSQIRSIIPVINNAPTLTAQAIVDNSKGQWITGSWVEAEVTVAQMPVALRVDNRALQGFRDWQVVFIQVGDVYEIRPLELGASDGNFTEVLSGLNVGDRYVVENSYLLKADLEKSGASHDH